jgi:hypothetical protein
LWRAWDLQQHRSEVNSDYQSAKICEVMVNMQRSSDSNPIELADFLIYDRPYDRPVRKGQTAEQMLAIAELLTDAYGGKRVLN